MIRDIIKIIYKIGYIWKTIRNLCDEKTWYLYHKTYLKPIIKWETPYILI